MRRAQAGGESGEGEVASAAVAPPMEPMVELPPVASKAILPPALKLSFTPPATLEADRRSGDIAALPPARATPAGPDPTPATPERSVEGRRWEECGRACRCGRTRGE